MNKFQNIKNRKIIGLVKLSVKLIIFWIFIYIILIYFYDDIGKVSSLTKDVFLQSFSTLMGVVIASVGILIGTISGLYTILIDVNKNKRISENISEDLDKLDEIVLELKEDTIILIAIYVLNLIVTYAINLDFKLKFSIPYYIEVYPLLSKILILTSLSIFLVLLGIWITYDIVMTIFTIYQAYILVTKNSLLSEDSSTK